MSIKIITNPNLKPYTTERRKQAGKHKKTFPLITTKVIKKKTGYLQSR